MPNTFVTIIGDQPAPNIFLIRDQFFAQIDTFLFLTTELMQQRRKLEHLVKALGLMESQYEVVKVPADDLIAIRDQLGLLRLEDRPGRFFVNITSGSKIMSIGVYDFFARAALERPAEIFYLSIRDRHFLRIHPEQDYQAFPLQHRLSLREYLNSHGVFYRFGPSAGRPKYDFAQASRMYDCYREGLIISALNQLLTRSREITRATAAAAPKLPLLEVPLCRQLLYAIGFKLKDPIHLDRQEIKYLLGEWFEEWAFYRLKTQLGLADDVIACSLHVEQQGESGRAGFDVLFLHQDQLFVVECKSGLARSFHDAKRTFDAAALRLAALRSTFGLKVTAVYLTLTDKLRNRSQRMKPSVRDKAQYLEVNILDAIDLLEPPKVWISRLIGPKP